MPYKDFGISQKELFVCITCQWNPLYCTSQEKAGAPPYPENHWVLVDHACLLNEANSLLYRAVSYMHQTITFKINNAIYFSHKIVKLITLSYRFGIPNFSNWLCLHEPSSLFICPERTMSLYLFPVKVRFCASDPIQDCIKGESLCKPC